MGSEMCIRDRGSTPQGENTDPNIILTCNIKSTILGAAVNEKGVTNLSFSYQAYSSNDFVPALKLAQENGLKLALHIAEVKNVRFQKTQ